MDDIEPSLYGSTLMNAVVTVVKYEFCDKN